MMPRPARRPASGRSTPPPSPLAGSIAARRAREAIAERAVLASLTVLALTVTGFAGYTIATGTHGYDVQAVLPAGPTAFAWKKTVTQGRLADPDFDPLTTGSLPERPPAVAASLATGSTERPALPGTGGYALRGVSDGVATLEGRGGPLTASLGSVLPGAGRVLSIRRTGAGWIVITTETIIGPSRP